MELPEPRDVSEVMGAEWVARLRGASHALAVLGMQVAPPPPRACLACRGCPAGCAYA